MALARNRTKFANPVCAVKAQTGVEIQFYSFFNLDARWGGASTQRTGSFTADKNPEPIVQEVG